MQSGNVVDVSKNVDYGSSTLKLSSNRNDSDKDSEKSFKKILSSDSETEESDINQSNDGSGAYFNLSNDDFNQKEDLSKKNDAVIGVFFIEPNINVEYPSGYNLDCNNDIQVEVNDNSEIIINNNDNAENLTVGQLIDDVANKKDFLKDSDIDYDEISNSEPQNETEPFVTDFGNTNGNELENEDFANDDIIEQSGAKNAKLNMIKKDTNGKIKQKRKENRISDENIGKTNSLLGDNSVQVSLTGRKSLIKNDKEFFNLGNYHDKKATTFNVNVLKNDENVNLKNNDVESILRNEVVQSRVLNSTKNALAECIKSKDGEFDLYLEPKSLGVLKIKVAFKENNAISVVFNATNPQAIDILKQETSDIVNMISSLGFDVNSDSLNFNFSQNNSDSGFFKNSFFNSNSGNTNDYIEDVGAYKKVWILNDRNVDVLV